jgi:hypothetical protein
MAVKRKTLTKTKISKKKQPVSNKQVTKVKSMASEHKTENVGVTQPVTTERDILIHQWKCCMASGDLGGAEVIRKKIKPIEPPSSE